MHGFPTPSAGRPGSLGAAVKPGFAGDRSRSTAAATDAAKGIAMSLGLIGYKVGMTQVFTTEGVAEPVTVLQLGPCPVLQIKYPSAQGEKGGTTPKDGYTAVQLGFKDKKRKNATRPEQGHVAAGLKSKRKEARQKAGVALPPKA